MKAFSQFATAIAASEVIARRMPLMWWAAAAPTAARQAEMVRMVSEKSVAAFEGLAAANARMAGEAFALWGWALSGRLAAGSFPAAAARIGRAAASPSVRRVKANRARLRRREAR